MRIDLLVQKTVVHNFLRILQSTFPLLLSTAKMESSRSSTQTLTTTSDLDLDLDLDLINFATREGTRQQREPITVGPYHLTHPAVYIPCGRKLECPEETHDFRQSVDFLLFSREDWVRIAFRDPAWESNLRP